MSHYLRNRIFLIYNIFRTFRFRITSFFANFIKELIKIILDLSSAVQKLVFFSIFNIISSYIPCSLRSLLNFCILNFSILLSLRTATSLIKHCILNFIFQLIIILILLIATKKNTLILQDFSLNLYLIYFLKSDWLITPRLLISWSLYNSFCNFFSLSC